MCHWSGVTTEATSYDWNRTELLAWDPSSHATMCWDQQAGQNFDLDR